MSFFCICRCEKYHKCLSLCKLYTLMIDKIPPTRAHISVACHFMLTIEKTLRLLHFNRWCTIRLCLEFHWTSVPKTEVELKFYKTELELWLYRPLELDFYKTKLELLSSRTLVQIQNTFQIRRILQHSNLSSIVMSQVLANWFRSQAVHNWPGT